MKIPKLVVLAVALIIGGGLMYFFLAKKGIAPEMFPGGPSGEQAYFQLKTTTTVMPEGQDLLLNILLDTCGGGLCANVTASDVQITYDPVLLEPRTEDGTAVATQAKAGSLFTSYFQNNISNGTIYIAAYSLPTDANPTFSSEGKSDPQKVFAQIRFKVKGNSGTTKLAVAGTDATSDSTNIYMKDFNSDIFTRDVNDPNKSGENTLTLTGTNPGTMSLTTGSTQVNQGNTFTVNIMADTGGVKTAGYDAIVHFNPSILRITTVAKNDTLGYNINTIPSVLDNTNGIVKVAAAAAPDPGFGGANRLATLTFSAQNTGSSDLTFDFTLNQTTESNLSFFSGVPVTAQTGGLDLLGSVNNISVTVNAASSPVPTPSTSPSEAPSPSSVASPSPQSPTPSPSPSPTPSYIPSSTYNFRINPEGLAQGHWNMTATVNAKGTSWQKHVALNTDGTYTSLDLTGLNLNNTYDFIIKIHPYLSILRSVNLNNMPPTIDFSTQKTGDLNYDNQINSLDWSWMRKNFGQSGD